MLFEGRAGWSYIAANTRLPGSADMFLGRLWGVGDSLSQTLDSGTAGLIDVAFGTKQPWAQAVQTTDFVMGEIGEAADERLVDSWR
jgi:hypothetical protein